MAVGSCNLVGQKTAVAADTLQRAQVAAEYAAGVPRTESVEAGEPVVPGEHRKIDWVAGRMVVAEAVELVRGQAADISAEVGAVYTEVAGQAVYTEDEGQAVCTEDAGQAVCTEAAEPAVYIVAVERVGCIAAVGQVEYIVAAVRAECIVVVERVGCTGVAGQVVRMWVEDSYNPSSVGWVKVEVEARSDGGVEVAVAALVQDSAAPGRSAQAAADGMEPRPLPPQPLTV